MDGMRCDIEGNLYVTRHGKGTVAKVSPDGDVLLEVQLTGKLCTNIAFGGAGWSHLLCDAGGSRERGNLSALINPDGVGLCRNGRGFRSRRLKMGRLMLFRAWDYGIFTFVKNPSFKEKTGVQETEF